MRNRLIWPKFLMPDCLRGLTTALAVTAAASSRPAGFAPHRPAARIAAAFEGFTLGLLGQPVFERDIGGGVHAGHAAASGHDHGKKGCI